MKRRVHSGRLCTALVTVALLSGCGAEEEKTPGPSGNTRVEVEAIEEAPAAALPEPAVRWVDPPARTPEEQRKHAEGERYLAERYRGKRIVATTQTYLGDIVDWFDPATVPGSQIEPPPSPPPEELRPPRGSQLQRTELELYPELQGPEGTIPITRPTFASYVRGETNATSVEDFLRQQVPGRPATENRLYAGLVAPKANKGVVSWVNDFPGTIEMGTFSVIETAAVCPGSNPATTMELVGIATSRDWVNFGDTVLRLQVEFLTAGDLTGNGKGGWDGKSTGFLPAAGRPYGPGIALFPVSTVDGIQYTSRFEILLFNGNWWVGHNWNWLGYYPGYLFDLIRTSGCQAHWYGEVYDPTPTDWTWTNMASGLFASGGFGKAGYVMTPWYTDPSGVSHWPDGAVNAPPSDAACYTRSSLLMGEPGQERYFFLAGPGGDAVGCN